MNPRAEQIVQVRCTGSQTSNGSGYLIAPGVVLTAAHVLSTNGIEPTIAVRRLTDLDDSRWLIAERVVFPDSAFDVALILLREVDPDDRTPHMALCDVSTALPYRAVGFPRVQRDGNRRHPEDVSGTVAPLSGSSDVLSLDVASATPLLEDYAEVPAPTGWSGMSGAAVFTIDNLLLGVIVLDHTGFGGRRLEAVALASILNDVNLRAELPEIWESTGRRHVSNLLAFRVGGQLGVQLRPPQMWLSPTVRSNLATSLLTPLRAAYEIVPYLDRPGFDGRSNTRVALDWLQQPHPRVGFGLITGTGGSGKSRLAAEVAKHALTLGWVAGFVTIQSSDLPRYRLTDLHRPVLLVLDQMETRVDEAAELISHLIGAEPDEPVRLLFLIRSGETFARRLSRRLGLDDPEPSLQIQMLDRELDINERHSHYVAAREAYARLREMPVTPTPIGPELTRRLEILPTPLLIHAQALVDLTEGHRDHDQPDVAEKAISSLLSRLLDREDARFWEPALREYHLTRDDRWDALSLATFANAHSVGTAGALLRRIPALSDGRARAAQAAGTLHELYGGGAHGYLPTVEPDLLGEHLIASRGLSQQAAQIFAEASTPAQRSRMLEVLLRMAVSAFTTIQQSARSALRSAITTHLPALVDQAIEVVRQPVEGPASALPERITAALGLAPDPAAAASVVAEIPAYQRLQGLKAIIAEQASEFWQARGDLERTVDQLQRATQAYLSMGQIEQALPVSNSALTFASRFPALSRDPRLGRLLTSHSLIRAGSGNAAAAINAARQSVEAASQAALQEPQRYQVQLAEARCSLILAFFVAADRVSARQVAADAVVDADLLPPDIAAQVLQLHATTLLIANQLPDAIHSLLRAQDRLSGSAYVAELASITVQLGYLRMISGEPDEAMHMAMDAINLADQAGQRDSDINRQAKALIRLGAAGIVYHISPERAVELLEAARRMLRELHDETPELYEQHYSGAQLAYAEALVAVGQIDRGVRQAALAASLVKELVQKQPLRNYYLLAASAMTQAFTYTNAGRPIEAIEVLDATIHSLKSIGVAGTNLHVAQLLVVRTLLQLEHTEDYDNASTTIAQAVEIYRELAGNEPQTFLPELVGGLILTMMTAAAGGQVETALNAGQDAVQHSHRLVELVRTDGVRRQQALVFVLRGNVFQGSGRLAEAINDFKSARQELSTVAPLPGDADDFAYIDGRISDCTVELAGVVGPTSGPADKTQVPDTLAKLFIPDWTMESAAPGRHRVTLGRFQGRLIAADSFRPVLVVGPQRSRKTTSMVTPTLLEWDGPALVTSVRTDVLAASFRRRIGMGKVSVFEPTGRLAHGEVIRPWNPLDDCHTWEGAIRTARSLTESSRVTATRDVTNGEFWQTSAMQALQPLLLAAARTGQTMAAVIRWVKSMEDAEVRARLSVTNSPEAIRAFAALRGMAEVTRGSVYATLSTLLTGYDSEAVQRNSLTGFDVPSFFDGEANTLYLCAPPDEQHLLAPIFTALVRRVISEAYHRQAIGLETLPLLLLLDEAGNIATIEGLDTLATTAAGTQIQLVTVFHDLAQMHALYPSGRADSIANNHSAQLLLPNNRDPRTSDWFQKVLADDKTGVPLRSLRRMATGTALCVYDNLAANIIQLRSSDYDDDLLQMAGPSIEDDPKYRDLLAFGPAPSGLSPGVED